MNLIGNMCLKIALPKLQPQLPGANELILIWRHSSDLSIMLYIWPQMAWVMSFVAWIPGAHLTKACDVTI